MTTEVTLTATMRTASSQALSECSHSQVPKMSQVSTRKPTKPRTCWSRSRALRWPRRRATNRVKGRLPSIMKITATQCTAGWLQLASELSEVE
ncbi:hypothetical protein D3C78_1576450 [compost metagenome]